MEISQNQSFPCLCSKSQSLIAVFVKKNRKTQKMTQRDLAAKAGVGLRLDKVNVVLALFEKEVGVVSREVYLKKNFPIIPMTLRI